LSRAKVGLLIIHADRNLAERILAPLLEVPYVDDPDLQFNEHESTSMPFRYVKDKEGKPIMPKVSPFYAAGLSSNANA
jgi:ribosome biogenesis SPOUT family RNA methylase Rps3